MYQISDYFIWYMQIRWLKYVQHVVGIPFARFSAKGRVSKTLSSASSVRVAVLWQHRDGGAPVERGDHKHFLVGRPWCLLHVNVTSRHVARRRAITVVLYYSYVCEERNFSYACILHSATASYSPSLFVFSDIQRRL